ncbi:MAG: isocitrate lyase/phosphoenolpyruvate mutase family protein, partial [Gammaproteobacteria bacterium]|nr:isocitrate lyase/phosphoenolpyruvate mutase family protein [Gammaproteobacteria bacterium]
MSRWSTRRARFRSLLEGSACVHPASVFDPLSARIAEDLGFESSMLAGSIASLTVLGAPDLIVLTLTELAEQTLRISRAGELPLLVDADHGFGNALNVMRTVEELENAGVSALSIEDTLLPQAYGSAKPQLISLEEGVGKMRAAVAARRDPSLVIAGRTHLGITDVDDAVRRISAYAAAGVDAIFLVGVKTRDDLAALTATVDVPLILGGHAPELQDRDYLASQGVRVALQGHKPFMAAVQGVYDTLRALKEG